MYFTFSIVKNVYLFYCLLFTCSFLLRFSGYCMYILCMLHVSFFLSPKEPCLMVNRLFPCVRRISQDLAKDLAILAREIHDVAGEIDSVSSSGTAPSTTVSTAATTPGSAIDTREEVGSARPTQLDIQESMRQVHLSFFFWHFISALPSFATPKVSLR